MNSFQQRADFVCDYIDEEETETDVSVLDRGSTFLICSYQWNPEGRERGRGARDEILTLIVVHAPRGEF